MSDGKTQWKKSKWINLVENKLFYICYPIYFNYLLNW